MGVKVATTCLQWSQPIVHHSSCYSQTLASIVPYPSSTTRRNRRNGGGRCVYSLSRPGLFGIQLTKFQRSRSCCDYKPRIRTIRTACSAHMEDGFSDEEFSKQIQELALRFQVSSDVNSSHFNAVSSDSVSDSSVDHEFNTAECSLQNQIQITPPQLVSTESPWPEIYHEPSEWTQESEIIPDDIERKANSVDLPLSLRILKRKMQWHDGIREARESAYCSVKKAFSSMVFMIRELHSYSLKLREILFYEDLQGILNRVEKEMHASFVWLFQQVFSHTPTLMVYVMILLANFTVYSMGNNLAIASSSSPSPSITQTAEESFQIQNQKPQKFHSSTIKTFSVSGKTNSIGGGNGGGGGKVRPIASGTDGDGFNRSVNYPTVMPDGTSQLSSIGASAEEETSITGGIIREEEVSLWNSILKEASEMRSAMRNEAIDEETVRRLVSPVIANIESDNYAEYFRTELLYQTGLSQDPNNPLLLTNYAQFLCLVAHDYDRAEEYFKKAVAVKPPDADAFHKYATFLWRVRKDLWAAEELFLESVSAESGNPFYAAKYASFLWTNGAEETCLENL
ncbi:uncharacterized protein LOC101211174 [Cucumis sativus]|uniref:Uncharacterized protein n=1 Tax=Cucumis sativus TaxID=3659 RepID=A0A0A0KE41_CUCSA|nr:uncharacterized protein LOC101211174 [Cucumis sativus]KGN47094.1 hypothetical protein Csa_020865 [Cucumis sativus]